MKSSLVLLGFLLSLALLAQRAECFTAGIGNLGIEGKRSMATKYEVCTKRLKAPSAKMPKDVPVKESDAKKII